MGAPASCDLQITLRHPFIFKTAALKQTARGVVFRQAGRFNAAQIKFAKSMGHQPGDRLAHIALTGEALSGPIPQSACLSRASADIVQCDGPHQRLIGLTEQK